MTSSQKRGKLNTLKEAVIVAHRRHKILIIGDSHVRRLADKVSSGLDDAFSVTGITKPNADIEGITSSLHISIDNLTKRHDYILWWNQRYQQERIKKRTLLLKSLCT
jgi:hypothetical protein